MTERVRVSIVGGSGYGGGELLRLLLGHPQVEIAQVTSESHSGEFVHSLHPNLRPTGKRLPSRTLSLSKGGGSTGSPTEPAPPNQPSRTLSLSKGDGSTGSPTELAPPNQPSRTLSLSKGGGSTSSPTDASPSQPIRFTSISELQPCDVLFLALPHGEAQKRIERLAALAGRIVDLSADFRVRDPALYQRYYAEPHTAPTWVERFAYGLPEVNRDAIRNTQYASGVGCNATASILALLPVVRAGLLLPGQRVIVDLKAGSSEGGASASAASHHPERRDAVRSFAPVGHRHEAEVIQALGRDDVFLSVTSVELVRGVLATAHAWVAPGTTDKDLWRAYRAAYGQEPFVRIVHERGGIYRHPEPKLLAGTNLADVGWELDPKTGRLVALAAIDNLGKGAAGTAVQCMNLMLGWDETLGLEFTGLHPV